MAITAAKRIFTSPQAHLNPGHSKPGRAGLGLALLAATLLLAACETSTRLDTPGALAPVETRTPVVSGNAAAAANAGAGTAATAAATTSPSTLAGTNLAAANATSAAAAAAQTTANAQRVVYFDFDSFVIRDDFRGMLDAHAKLLSQAANKRMVIEGHTDERGGREYNLALGQRRAEAVLRSLALLGVNDSRLEAVSFGQERPAAQGSDEASYAMNRRAELKDR